jgi:O-acetyl-ADP-ribose deacetylase (regulator of RNase III)
MITYIKGDLFQDKHAIIAHGCNCMGVMGSGVARIVKEKWPEAFTLYNRICNDHFLAGTEASLLGQNILAHCNDGTIIVNCITQHSYGRTKERYVSYDAVDACFSSLRDGVKFSYYDQQPTPYVAMPMIGAGLGGGSWEVIEAIIKHRLHDIDVRVYQLE